MYFNRGDRSLLGDWFWRVDKLLLFAFLLLIFLGTFFIFSATPYVATTIHVERFYFVKKHFLYLIPSIAIIIFFSAFDIKIVRRIVFVIFFVNFILLFFVPIFGSEIKGAKRWINLFFFSFQPSEFIKFSFVVFSAWLIHQDYEKSDFRGKEASYVFCFSVLGLLVLEPDIGMTFLIFSAWFSQIFIAGVNWVVLFFLLLIGIFSMIGCYFIFPHFMMRVDNFFHSTESYQIKKSIASFVNGGLWGVGPGEGAIKRFLPDAHSDFIFSVIGEEFGVIVCSIILFIYLFIIIRSFYLAINSENLFVLYSVVGITVIFAMQTVINIASSLNLMPTKGMTLPFISYGGSSYIAMSIYAGVLLCLTKKSIDYNKFYL